LFRATALPTFLEQVKPIRIGASSLRLRDWRTKLVECTRWALASCKKSLRCVIRFKRNKSGEVVSPDLL